MSAEIIHLQQGEVGDGYVVPPDNVLEHAKGKFHSLTVVGETEDGEIQVCGTHSPAETLMLLAWAQNFLVQNRVAR